MESPWGLMGQSPLAWPFDKLNLGDLRVEKTKKGSLARLSRSECAVSASFRSVSEDLYLPRMLLAGFSK